MSLLIFTPNQFEQLKEMVVFPGCKINIGLNIIEKRMDGYHNLKSIFYPISLSDILEIVPSDQFSFNSTGLEIPGENKDNLVVKAYHLMVNAFDIPPVKIHLHKLVPMGAGLGGGSANCAQTFVVLNRLFDLNISTERLETLADSLGSDCAFFIQNTPAYVEGKGEKVTPIDMDLKGYYIQLINPGIHIQTKMAFSGVHPNPNNSDLKALVRDNPKIWNGAIKNDFEKSVFPHHPKIEEIKTQLYASGASYASMTGTGSTVYGIFEQKPQKQFPSYFEWIKQL